MPGVDVRRLAKVYPGGAVGLTEVDLSVADGELFVLVGPSGSGKTTLLRLLAGLEDPSGGTIHFGDRRVDALPPHRRGVSYLAQRAVLYPDRSVCDNLLFALDAGPETVRAAEELAEQLGLSGLLGRRPGQLSGGELQRAALGRALLRPAGVVLLDEPLSSLDGPLRVDVRRILPLLRSRRRATMIVVTHDQDDALTLADRLAVLDQGRLIQAGTPAELLSRPATLFVARQLGWPALSFARGRMTLAEGLPLFAGGGFRVAAPPEWGRFADREAVAGWRSTGGGGEVAPRPGDLDGAFLFDAATGRLLHAPPARG